MLQRVHAVWIYLGALVVACALGGLHSWWTPRVYEAQARVRIPPAVSDPAIEPDGTLPPEVLTQAIAQLSQQDVRFPEPGRSEMDTLADGIRGQVHADADLGANEARLRFRSTQPDTAVPVLRAVMDAWLKRIGCRAGDEALSAVQKELERTAAALARQRQHMTLLEKVSNDLPSDDASALALAKERDLERAALAEARVDRDEAEQVIKRVHHQVAQGTPVESMIEQLPDETVRSKAWSLFRRAGLEQDFLDQQARRAMYEGVYGRNHPKRRAVEERMNVLLVSLGGTAPDQNSQPLAERLLRLVEDSFARQDALLVAGQTKVDELESRWRRHEEHQASLRAARTELLRLEQAHSAVERKLAEASADDRQAEIVLPPTLLMEPVWPILQYELGTSVLAGLVLGAVVSWRRSVSGSN